MTDFVLSSPDIPAGGTIPQEFEFNSFGCTGRNESPVLRWQGAPAGTQSLALTVYDPDAPSGSGWWQRYLFSDGFHPTPYGHKLFADQVLDVLDDADWH